MVHGFERNGKKIELVWDTGSDKSLLDGPEAKWDFLQRNNQLYPLPVVPAIVPLGYHGLLGLDFFPKNCILWNYDELWVFAASDPFCLSPETFLQNKIQYWKTKQRGIHTFVNIQEGEGFWALLDTGATVSLLPEIPESEDLGERTVSLTKQRTRMVRFKKRTKDLILSLASGEGISYQEVEYLTGISLVDFDFPGDKDSREVWVVGLNVLRRFPIFWDFSRNRVGIVTPIN